MQQPRGTGYPCYDVLSRLILISDVQKIFSQITYTLVHSPDQAMHSWDLDGELYGPL